MNTAIANDLLSIRNSELNPSEPVSQEFSDLWFAAFGGLSAADVDARGDDFIDEAADALMADGFLLPEDWAWEVKCACHAASR